MNRKRRKKTLNIVYKHSTNRRKKNEAILFIRSVFLLLLVSVIHFTSCISFDSIAWQMPEKNGTGNPKKVSTAELKGPNE